MIWRAEVKAMWFVICFCFLGINHGPVIAGVIGAQKPQYDIWGNSVNVASRMETTGVLGKIQVRRLTKPQGNDLQRACKLLTLPMFFSVQVTEETSGILSTLGYMCSCRGIINVKGKGDLKTYFVHTEMTRSLSQGTVMPWACNTNEQIRLENTITHSVTPCSVTKTHYQKPAVDNCGKPVLSLATQWRGEPKRRAPVLQHSHQV